MKRMDISTAKYPNTFALVDDADFERLSKWKWRPRMESRVLYVVRTVNAPRYHLVYMHREVLSAQPGSPIDHIDGNGLNNQKTNLRPCTNSQNQCNRGKPQFKTTSSRYKGVNYDRSSGKFRARIEFNKVRHNLGLYESEIAAAEAYNAAAVAYHGEFARPNQIEAAP